MGMEAMLSMDMVVLVRVVMVNGKKGQTIEVL